MNMEYVQLTDDGDLVVQRFFGNAALGKKTVYILRYQDSVLEMLLQSMATPSDCRRSRLSECASGMYHHYTVSSLVCPESKSRVSVIDNHL